MRGYSSSACSNTSRSEARRGQTQEWEQAGFALLDRARALWRRRRRRCCRLDLVCPPLECPHPLLAFHPITTLIKTSPPPNLISHHRISPSKLRSQRP